ncbi:MULTISPECIES: DUF3219 family protein [Oceanobacillus]|uniref:DUF3219 domain-containing protein n=1 Tax=Oceanobacillus sojae TaxID=582851 RepID=A0A511ZK99_9BACI|nr:DUF3219 family protein [Oceanobacillus sojae]GEN87882.1 hypothetical protein OSO01_26210 [Oceanobacillus sojae]
MEIKINGQIFEGKQVELDEIAGKKQIAFSFDVTSETYHDVTTLLYKNDFQVNIPEKSLSFPAVIQEYSTSTTNLYEKGNTSEFYLKVREK